MAHLRITVARALSPTCPRRKAALVVLDSPSRALLPSIRAVTSRQRQAGSLRAFPTAWSAPSLQLPAISLSSIRPTAVSRQIGRTPSRNAPVLQTAPTRSLIPIPRRAPAPTAQQHPVRGPRALSNPALATRSRGGGTPGRLALILLRQRQRQRRGGQDKDKDVAV